MDVYKSFGSKKVLNGVSFSIMKGEALGIIGPSGTGKSTVLKIMAGLLEPDAGHVYIRGKRVQGLLSDKGNSSEALGLRVGLVFQSGALFDSLTVRENVGFLLYEHSDLPSAVIDKLVSQGLEKVGLKGMAAPVVFIHCTVWYCILQYCTGLAHIFPFHASLWMCCVVLCCVM